jgi:hypothetical protein
MRSNRTDDNVATIAALIITFIIGVFILAMVSKCEAWTESEFRADKYGELSDWKLSSLPREIRNSEFYEQEDRLGAFSQFSYVLAVRELGKWDDGLLFLGPIAVGPDIDRLDASLKISAAMKAVDKVLPDEKVVVISFIVYYTEMDIVFGPERWQDKDFHVKAAKKMNEEREKWKKWRNAASGD